MQALNNSQKYNVIVVLSDDQGYGDLSCHGNPYLETPNFDKLHDESFRFTDFHTAPMCTPARSQIMTGLDALRNKACQINNGRTFIKRGIPTMADIFAQNGYRTGIFGKWHLGENYPFRPQDRGFQESVIFPGASVASSPDYWNNDCFDDCYIHNGELQKYEGYFTDVFFDEAMKWMKESKDSGQKFFTYLATGADHTPYFVPDKYREPYRHLGVYLSSFYAMIANYDENMGRLDEFLKTNDLYENTILIFMADNGAAMSASYYNAGMRGNKGSLYEGGHRVPCFIRWPEGNPGESDIPTVCQDILPTLIDLCNLDTDASFDGLSLKDIMTGHPDNFPDRMKVIQINEPEKWNSVVIWKKWRLINGTELYNLQDDPSQQNDVSGHYKNIVKKMRDYYEFWWNSLGDVDSLEMISVGTEFENPVKLNAADWREKSLHLYQTHIRGFYGLDGKETLFNGKWYVTVEKEGKYEFFLRRWPKEADAPISGSVPEYIPADTTFADLELPEESNLRVVYYTSVYPEGKPLPVAKARIKVGENDLTCDVGPDDKVVTFSMNLKKGDTTIQTWFYDKNGEEICGAMFVDVLYLD